jgi:hypothetical protein
LVGLPTVKLPHGIEGVVAYSPAPSIGLPDESMTLGTVVKSFYVRIIESDGLCVSAELNDYGVLHGIMVMDTEDREQYENASRQVFHRLLGSLGYRCSETIELDFTWMGGRAPARGTQFFGGLRAPDNLIRFHLDQDLQLLSASIWLGPCNLENRLILSEPEAGKYALRWYASEHDGCYESQLVFTQGQGGVSLFEVNGPLAIPFHDANGNLKLHSFYAFHVDEKDEVNRRESRVSCGRESVYVDTESGEVFRQADKRFGYY